MEEEELLWEQQILGSTNPTQLVHTLVHLIGLNFALRGGAEHHRLRMPENNGQLQIVHQQKGKKCLVYTEDVSKANQGGGLDHMKVKRKVVHAFPNTNNPERCIVNLFEKYVLHCPPSTEALYLRPLEGDRKWENESIWYCTSPMGRQKLAGVVSGLCSKAGLEGFRTNHSLRASAASRLYAEGVDEQPIKEVTGHRSNAVREYQRTNKDQMKCVNKIVQGCSSTPSAPIAPTAVSLKTEPTESTSKRQKLEHGEVQITVNVSFNN